MSDSEGLYYSPEALAARYTLLQGKHNIKQNLNNINLFVEDTGKEYQYESIFKRLFKDAYPVVDIFPVGGKKELKKRYLEFGLIDSKNPSIKNIYIADGDFDRYICAEEMISDPQFIYLNAYNIESYFIDEESSTQYVKGQLKCLDKEVKHRFNFDLWKTKIIYQSTKLFLVYCFISKYYPEIPSISRACGNFLNMETGFEREDGAFDNFFNEIKEMTKDTEIQEKIDKIKDKYISINGSDFYNLICGKFLFTSLCAYIRSITGKAFCKTDFEWYLINNFDITKLDYIKEKIVDITSSHG